MARVRDLIQHGASRIVRGTRALHSQDRKVIHSTSGLLVEVEIRVHMTMGEGHSNLSALEHQKPVALRTIFSYWRCQVRSLGSGFQFCHTGVKPEPWGSV